MGSNATGNNRKDSPPQSQGKKKKEKRRDNQGGIKTEEGRGWKQGEGDK